MEPEQVDHVIVGQVLQAGQGQIPSRQAQIKAGIPKEVSSETINKVCASGCARACCSTRRSAPASAGRRRGRHGVDVQGALSDAQGRFGYRMGDAKVLDAMVHDGLTNPFSGKQMFVEATEVGDELEMTRADLDRWALRSHELALKAIDDGRMSEEIVAVTIPNGSPRPHGRRDRRGSAPRNLAGGARQAAGLVGKEGSHTAGNSPGVNDGAGALVLASDEWAAANGKERARGDRRPRPERQRLRLPRHDPRHAPPARRSRRPACSPATSTCGRSTRRSRR